MINTKPTWKISAVAAILYRFHSYEAFLALHMPCSLLCACTCRHELSGRPRTAHALISAGVLYLWPGPH